MRIHGAVNIEDIRRIAKRRLPRIAYDFLEGGVDDELCLARNRAAFERYALVPRYLVNVERRDQSVALFGRTYSSPFGIGAAGVAGLFRPGADRMLAEEAAAGGIPFLMSAASALSIEEAAVIGPETVWFQVYGTRDFAIMEDQIARARDCGIGVLALTVDVPVNPRRERNIRNGFSRPLKLGLGHILDGLWHPGWLHDYLRSGGVPRLENFAKYAPQGAGNDAIADVFGLNIPAPEHEWPVLDKVRRLWPRTLIVKGILHPADAARAAEAGVDGLIVSNHGGRQIDRCPSPVEVIAAIRHATRDRLTLIIDSGVRRGTDVLVAACLGAKFALFARPTLFGAAAGGRVGIRKVLDILRAEVDAGLAQVGCSRFADLDDSYLLADVLGRIDGEARGT